MKKTMATTAMVLSLCAAIAASATTVGAMSYATQISSAPMQGMQMKAPQMVQMNSDYSFEMNNACVKISEPGDYTLTGQMQGTVYVDPGQGKVNITLDGVGINGQNAPAIVAVSGSELNITTTKGSVNYLSGTPNDQFGGLICSNVPVNIGGEGRLDMMSMGNNGFKMNDQPVSFNGGNVNIQAPDFGISAQNVSFNGGMVNTFTGMGGTSPDTQINMGQGEFNPMEMSDMNESPFDMGQVRPGDDSEFAQPQLPTQQTTIQQGQSQSPTQKGATQQGQSQFPTQQGQPDNMNGNAPEMAFGQNTNTQGTTDTALEIVEGITENSAMSLTADYENAVTYDVSEDSTVKISESGTYIVTGSASEGSITVKKGTTGVVLVLEDLDLTSTSGAVLSVNKQAEVQIIVSGTVTLTDNENPDDEYSEDADVADAYDGAAIKVKAESVVFITGDGTLNINGNSKNGIKAGDDTNLIIGGDVTVNINAVNDGINGNFDVTILSGDVNISAGDDGIHADHILTIGDSETSTGPDLTITKSNEGLEGTVVNIAGGNVKVTATDDGINAANGDGVYESELTYSVNITGGNTTVNTSADGIDSNGNVNLVNGSLSIRSASNGGDAGIDYDGEYYVSSSFNLNNSSGVAGPDGAFGQQSGMNGMPVMGNMSNMNASQSGGQQGSAPTATGKRR